MTDTERENGRDLCTVPAPHRMGEDLAEADAFCRAAEEILAQYRADFEELAK